MSKNNKTNINPELITKLWDSADELEVIRHSTFGVKELDILARFAEDRIAPTIDELLDIIRRISAEPRFCNRYAYSEGDILPKKAIL